MGTNRANRSGPKRKLGTGPEYSMCTETDQKLTPTYNGGNNGWNNGSSNLRRRYSLSVDLHQTTPGSSTRASGLSRRSSPNKRHPHGITRPTVQIGSPRLCSSADSSRQLDADQ